MVFFYLTWMGIFIPFYVHEIHHDKGYIILSFFMYFFCFFHNFLLIFIFQILGILTTNYRLAYKYDLFVTTYNALKDEKAVWKTFLNLYSAPTLHQNPMSTAITWLRFSDSFKQQSSFYVQNNIFQSYCSVRNFLSPHNFLLLNNYVRITIIIISFLDLSWVQGELVELFKQSIYEKTTERLN